MFKLGGDISKIQTKIEYLEQQFNKIDNKYDQLSLAFTQLTQQQQGDENQ